MTDGARELRHVQLAHSLGEEIARGRWRVGTRLPSTRVLARQFRTSLSTVHAALGALDDQGLVERRHGSGVYLTALPSTPEIRPLTRVGVMIPDRRYFAAALEGIAAVLTPLDVSVSVVLSHRQAKTEHDAVLHLVRSRVDALIMATTDQLRAEDQLWRNVLADLTIPVVLMERPPPDIAESRISHVSSDLRRGTRDAVGHLMSHGRHNLALYAPGMQHMWHGVIDGFVEAAHRAGAPLRSELIQTGPDVGAPDEFARRCLEYGADAVFCAHEANTLKLMPELRKLGMTTPRDVAIMELCDAAAAGHSLSGIRLPRYEIGAAAARLLVERFESGKESTCHISFRPELFIRGSCGPHN